MQEQFKPIVPVVRKNTAKRIQVLEKRNKID